MDLIFGMMHAPPERIAMHVRRRLEAELEARVRWAGTYWAGTIDWKVKSCRALGKFVPLVGGAVKVMSP